MSKKGRGKPAHERILNGSSQGRYPKFSSMNKNKKRDFKKYVGQGKKH